MGVISKRGIRGENKRPGRACQHCDSVENKILLFLNSLFLNSCSLKYYRQRGAAAATASRVTHLPVLYCDQHEFPHLHSTVLLHSVLVRCQHYTTYTVPPAPRPHTLPHITSILIKLFEAQ